VSDSSETSRTDAPVIIARLVPPSESRGTILLMLFVLMGALAVPMLWQSPHFSRRAKVVLAVLAVLQTVVALALVAWAAGWCVGQFSGVLNQY